MSIKDVQCRVIDALLMGEDIEFKYDRAWMLVTGKGEILFRWAICHEPHSWLKPMTLRKALLIIETYWPHRLMEPD